MSFRNVYIQNQGHIHGYNGSRFHLVEPAMKAGRMTRLIFETYLCWREIHQVQAAENYGTPPFNGAFNSPMLTDAYRI